MRTSADTIGCRGVAVLARRRWRLRAGITALGLTLMAPAVAAADDTDPGPLRGSLSSGFTKRSYTDWGGFYIGGQFGAATNMANFSSGANSLISYILRDSILESQVANLTTMGSTTTNRPVFGGFIGYNFYNLDKIVIGTEVNYTHLSMDTGTADGLTRIIQNDTGAPSGHHYFYTTTVNASAAVSIKDYATARMRLGYQTGQFLPYGFAGAVVGRASYNRTASVSYTTEDKPDTAIPPIIPDPPPNFAGSKTEAQSNIFAYGSTMGLGVDIAILPNLFLRAEWEYIHFQPIHDIKVDINSGRVGLGLKF